MKEPLFPLEKFASQIALIDGDTGREISYAECAALQREFSSLLKERSLLFLFTQNKPEEVMAYLSALNQRQVVCLLDARLHADLKRGLIETYHPTYVLNAEPLEGYHRVKSPFSSLSLWKIDAVDNAPPLHPDLALLLSSSGTTGSPKMIRLSASNITSNAQSIIQYLNLDANERAIASLPIHYSYGLSVFHTHLLSGATLVLTQASVLQPEFWTIMQRHACTSLAGVPYTYAMLDRIGFETFDLPALKTMTQAGGHLEKRLVKKFHATLAKRGGRFFVMYGQTEATARIAYLPPEMLPEKAGAIGRPIPQGKLRIYRGEVEVITAQEPGELVYEGPNVMMGYAEKAEDLAKGDLLKGVLHTGDLGYFDEEAIFYVTGRMKRISKVYGFRINLDEIEAWLHPQGPVAATSDDQKIYLYFEGEPKESKEQLIHWLSDKLKVHYTTFECRYVKQFPLTPSGKIDYNRL